MLADDVFKEHRDRLNELTELISLEGYMSEAVRDIEIWEKRSGMKPTYTANELAQARRERNAANDYQNDQFFELQLLDGEHLACISNVVYRNLSHFIMEKNEFDKKLGVVELSARLMPALTFPGSSKYFEVGIIPYGKDSRKAIGEKPLNSFVSSKVAKESATNLARTFGVHYALAETSSAPREDVPKSGKKPEVYICGVVGNEVLFEQHHLIDTPFRAEFNSNVRELMYLALTKMYGL